MSIYVRIVCFVCSAVVYIIEHWIKYDCQYFVYSKKDTFQRKDKRVAVVGRYSIPIKIMDGTFTARREMDITHKEADVI